MRIGRCSNNEGRSVERLYERRTSLHERFTGAHAVFPTRGRLDERLASQTASDDTGASGTSRYERPSHVSTITYAAI